MNPVEPPFRMLAEVLDPRALEARVVGGRPDEVEEVDDCGVEALLQLFISDAAVIQRQMGLRQREHVRVDARSEAQGIVYLRGSIDQGVSAEAFTLPAHIASATDGFTVPAAIDGTKLGYVEVSQGEVLALDGANPAGTAKVDTYLDGISFPAT